MTGWTWTSYEDHDITMGLHRAYRLREVDMFGRVQPEVALWVNAGWSGRVVFHDEPQDRQFGIDRHGFVTVDEAKRWCESVVDQVVAQAPTWFEFAEIQHRQRQDLVEQQRKEHDEMSARLAWDIDTAAEPFVTRYNDGVYGFGFLGGGS